MMHPPHVAQRLHHGHLAGIGWHIRPIQGIKQNKPVCADRQGKGLPLLLAFGQAVFLDAPSIPLEPGWLRDPAQPVRRDRGHVVQRGAERFGQQFEQMQVVHGRQHVRAVGALLAPRLDQAAGFEALQHPVQQEVFRPLRDEAGAELRQHTEVEPWVRQLEPKRILPVDPGTHGIGGLLVAEALEELEHRD